MIDSEKFWQTPIQEEVNFKRKIRKKRSAKGIHIENVRVRGKRGQNVYRNVNTDSNL